MSSEIVYPADVAKYSQTFMITSVRGADYAERDRQMAVKVALEDLGMNVYLPFVDTEQEDHDGGINIVTANFNAIKQVVEDNSGIISIMYCRTSSGSFADIGTAMALSMMTGKELRLHVLNPDELDNSPSANFVLSLAGGSVSEEILEMQQYIRHKLDEYQRIGAIGFTWEGTKSDGEIDNGYHKGFRLGAMTAIMLQYPNARLNVSNMDKVIIPEGHLKSYEHVIHSLVNRGNDI